MYSAAFLHSCCVTVRQPGLSAQNPVLIILKGSVDGVMVVVAVVAVVEGKGVVVAVVVLVMVVVVVVMLALVAEVQTYCAK